MFDSAGLAGWVETAMELASGTLVSSKDRRDPSYAISHQFGNSGQTRVATRGRVSMRGIRARILPPACPSSVNRFTPLVTSQSLILPSLPSPARVREGKKRLEKGHH